MASFGFISVFTSSIVTPLQELAAASRNISQGKLDGEDIRVDNKDELGELVDSFNHMRHVTRDNIHTLEDNQRLAEQLHQEAVERAQMEKRLESARMDLLQSQIKPHFMYNSLTTIAALCDKNPAEAKRATLDFSRYLRGNIDSVNKMIPVPFKNEMEHINTYLSLEKLRFESRLNVVFDIETTDFSVPALTIQPLVENAVKHGICASADGTGTLTLKTWEEEKCFKISVSDDGAGFDVNKKPDDGREHIGLDNVRKRLLSMSNATMKIESEIGKGTTITVTVPKETRKSF